MQILRIACHSALALSLSGCGVTKPAELKKFKDVKKAVLRDDGLYNVICLDGSVETGITLEQLDNDDVCNPSPDNDPRAQFISECRKTAVDMRSPTFEALKLAAGKTDCGQTYDELSRRETIIIFAYPPAKPDAITSLEPIQYFPKLKSLGVFAQKVADLRPLSRLSSLENLALSFNHISDVSPLGNLKRLESLDLSNNRIRDFSPVEKLPRLKKLVRTGNPGS